MHLIELKKNKLDYWKNKIKYKSKVKINGTSVICIPIIRIVVVVALVVRGDGDRIPGGTSNRKLI